MEKGYKMLIVLCRGNIRHIDEFTKQLKKVNPLAEISLLTGCEQEKIPQSLKDNMHEIFILNPPRQCRIKLRPFSTIVNLYYYLEDYRRLSKNRRYDIVNIHHAKERYLVYALCYFRRMAKKIVISPWGGGDVLGLDETKKKQINQIGKLYRSADRITISPTSNSGKNCIRLFHTDPNKMKPLGWGMEMIDHIVENEKLKEITIQDAKDRFGVKDRYVIVCGYSTAPSHRHEEIISAVNSKKDQLPSNLTLLFPLTYGYGSPEYVQKIKNKCAECGLDAKYLTEFMTLDDLYRLRKATDVFVSMQPVDAGARSIYEYVLMEKKIVLGSWLKGNIYDCTPCFYFPVDNIEDLGNVIAEACYSDNKEISDEVKMKVLSRGWSNMIKRWDDMFIQLAYENKKSC
jgi:hypothetical protein